MRSRARLPLGGDGLVGRDLRAFPVELEDLLLVLLGQLQPDEQPGEHDERDDDQGGERDAERDATVLRAFIRSTSWCGWVVPELRWI